MTSHVVCIPSGPGHLPLATTIEIDDNDLIFRTARKEWKCRGNGALETIQADTGRRHKINKYSTQIVMEDRPNPNFKRSPDCAVTIHPGDQYFEYIGCVPAFQSGDRHCLACTREFFVNV